MSAVNCLLVDASVKSQLNIMRFINIYFGLSLTVEEICYIYGVEEYCWDENFKHYNLTEQSSSKALDTADREVLLSWIWARVCGEELGGYMDDNFTLEEFKERLSAPDWKEKLYVRDDVYKLIDYKTKSLCRVSFRHDAFGIPDKVSIEGFGVTVKAINEFLNENKDVIESMIIKNIKQGKKDCESKV